MGTVIGICISEKRGTSKHEVETAEFVENWGIREDAHAGNWHRQVSLLSYEKIEAFRAKGAEIELGAFGENLIVEGYDFKNLPVGTRFRCGEVLLEMTQIGKECHSHCEIYKKMGECIMPREGVFARVLSGGRICRGDKIEREPFGLYESLREKKDRGATLATVVLGAHAGEKSLFADGRLQWESQTGGMLGKHTEEILAEGRCRLIEIEGERIFCEQIGGEPCMVICGGGHVSIPMIKLGKMLGFHVTVLEDRPEFADNARRAGADTVRCDSFEDGMKQITGNGDTYFVIVTRGHRYDMECLRAAVGKPHAYVGMMGSRKRVELVKQQLEKEGISKDLLNSVHTPIGLSIDAETPEEIAVSVLAEIIQTKNQEKRTADYDGRLLACLTGEKLLEGKKVLATIIARKGSAPRSVGTKMLILDDGSCIGTIGGGCAENEIRKEGQSLMAEEGERNRLCVVDMTGREAEDAGMVCGGTIEVYLEKIE